MKLGELLLKTRKEKKISQAYISGISGVSEQRLSRLERDFTDAYAYELPLIAKGYDIPLQDLIDAVNKTGRIYR
ncbi:MAG: helix-turn-helix domain-containing protein [Lactobacillaceae bacterium]|nr:helix-turn-helix domain-containing protein [Lactobacillaceae bacterium]